jgi:hypothetical protein
MPFKPFKLPRRRPILLAQPDFGPDKENCTPLLVGNIVPATFYMTLLTGSDALEVRPDA